MQRWSLPLYWQMMLLQITNKCYYTVYPWRTCTMRYTVVVLCVCLCVCVCVCVSAFSILPSRTSRCPTRGSSSYSMGNVVKLKLLSSKVRSVINLCTVTKSSIFFMCNVSIYLSITRTEWECVIM